MREDTELTRNALECWCCGQRVPVLDDEGCPFCGVEFGEDEPWYSSDAAAGLYGSILTVALGVLAWWWWAAGRG